MAGAVANVAVNVEVAGAVNELNKVDRAASGLSKSFLSLNNVIAGLGIGLVAKSIADVGQKSEQSKNQLKALTAQYGELGVATQSVDRIQKTLGISTVDARQGFSQLFAALRGTGVSVKQLEVLFVGLTNAARLSGAGAAEAQGALLQLKQAFASGTLNGDELRSVLEAMPAFTQQLAKETDRLGMTTNATAADIKRLGSEGKITSTILFDAARKFATAAAPQLTTAEQLQIAFTNLKEVIAETFGPVILPGVKALSAALTTVGSFFKQNEQTIRAVANVVVGLFKALGPGVVAIFAAVKAFQAMQAAIKGAAVAKAFLIALTTGPAGLLQITAAAGVATAAYFAFDGALKGTNAELEKQQTDTAKAKTEFANMAQTVQGLPTKLNAAAIANKAFTNDAVKALQTLKEQGRTIQSNIQALDRGATITAKRYELQRASNELQAAELERAYSLATTAEQKFAISRQIFENQINAAKIEYNQALENIKLEERKLELRLEAEQIKLREIEAETKLQLLKAQEIKDERERTSRMQEIKDAGKEAMQSQQSVVEEVKSLLGTQRELSRLEIEIAELKLRTAEVVARQALEQREISIETERSRQKAEEQAQAIQQSTQNAQSLANQYSSVTQQIDGAVSAQLRLNAAQAAGAGGSTPRYAASGAYWQGGFRAFADGGVVTKPTLGMIGEGGQPEYVIPASKMDAAMKRYSSGVRGEAVVSNAGATGVSNSSANYTNQQNTYYGSGGGTSVNITTGPVLRMNNKNYVSVSDMQRGLAAAVGAAESNMMNRMSRSYAARRSMGL